jgi:hypothetical protein
MPPVQVVFRTYEHVIGCGNVSGFSLRRFSWPRAGMVMREPGPNRLSKLSTPPLTCDISGSGELYQRP